MVALLAVKTGVFAGKQEHTNTYEERVKEGVREIAHLRKGCVTKITFIFQVNVNKNMKVKICSTSSCWIKLSKMGREINENGVIIMDEGGRGL